MNAKISNVLKVHNRRDPKIRTSWSSDDSNLPPKHPGIRSKQSKRVAFCDTKRNSWSGKSDFKDGFLVDPKFHKTLPSQDTWDRCSSSGNSASCESDAKDEFHGGPKFPGIHRSKLKTQQRVSWEIDLIDDVKSTLNDLKIGSAISRNELPVCRSPDCWDLDQSSQSSRYSADSGTYSKELILTPPVNSSNRHFSALQNPKIPSDVGDRRNLNDDDFRKIVNGILEELRPARPERSISCSSSCSGCCSCCYGSCSNFGSCTPRPSTPAVDIPLVRPKPAFLARIHGASPRESSCSCAHCTIFKNPFSSTSTSSWMTNSSCSQCLPPFEKDSLDSKISIDSLNHQSIFSLDSLNSPTDPDSLEYAKTNMSSDSLDSLDSCCNYDSLSDSKDSGFFSCSLPVVCWENSYQFVKFV